MRQRIKAFDIDDVENGNRVKLKNGTIHKVNKIIGTGRCPVYGWILYNIEFDTEIMPGKKEFEYNDEFIGYPYFDEQYQIIEIVK